MLDGRPATLFLAPRLMSACDAFHLPSPVFNFPFSMLMKRDFLADVCCCNYCRCWLLLFTRLESIIKTDKKIGPDGGKRWREKSSNQECSERVFFSISGSIFKKYQYFLKKCLIMMLDMFQYTNIVIGILLSMYIF